MAASTTLSHVHPCVFCSVWMCITYSFIPPPSPLWLTVCLPSIISLSQCFLLPLCLCFSRFLSVPRSSHCTSVFLLLPSCCFLPLVCAVDCLPKQHVAGGERKRQQWGVKKAHWQKLFPPSSLVATKKYINYHGDWMMLAQLGGCCFCLDEWCSSAHCRFLCWLVFVLHI